MKLLLTHINELLQVREECPTKLSGDQMKDLPTIKNAWLYIEHGKIIDFGSMDHMPRYEGHKNIVPTDSCNA